jgi:hypothetical protein
VGSDLAFIPLRRFRIGRLSLSPIEIGHRPSGDACSVPTEVYERDRSALSLLTHPQDRFHSTVVNPLRGFPSLRSVTTAPLQQERG